MAESAAHNCDDLGSSPRRTTKGGKQMRGNDLTGKTFGKLYVLGRDMDSEKGKPKWICKCQCENVCSVYGTNLTAGRTVSCGCVRSENARVRMSNKKREKTDGAKKDKPKTDPGVCYNVWCPHRNNYKGAWTCTESRYCPGKRTKRKTEYKPLDII